MLAGIAKISVSYLYAAADEGIMPQTKSILKYCKRLESMMVNIASPKKDMVDEEWLRC